MSSDGSGPGGGWRGSADDLIADFVRWSADERARQAARNRTLERSLREEASAAATWLGALVHLAEARCEVSMGIGATRVSGTLEAVGTDFCVVIRGGRRPVLVRLDKISAMWTEATGGRQASGSRFPALELSMAAAMSLLAEERAPVTVALAGGHQVNGDLLSVGQDVLTIRTADGSRRSAFIPISSLEYCELR